MEHIKEYGMENSAIREIKRITKHNGLVIVGTPNNEMLGDHGFSFEEIQSLFDRHFTKFCVFENALLPFDQEALMKWEKRKNENKVGIIITENINFSETVLPLNISPKVKVGLTAGDYIFDNLIINTESLHNTHSWLVIALNDRHD